MTSNQRFVLSVFLLLGTALLLHAHRRSEFIPPHQKLASFPQTVGNWTGQNEGISPDILEVLGPGDFLARSFENRSPAVPRTSLFVAYFPSQRFGSTVHSPKNCLPGTGWTVLESNTVNISLAGNKPFPANRYLIAMGAERQLVLYWYWAHGRSSASEYRAKLYLIEDSIRLNRSDGSLIRFNTQLQQGESEAAAEQRLISLAAEVVPVLSSYLGAG
jgi:EpsI family protein